VGGVGVDTSFVLGDRAGEVAVVHSDMESRAAKADAVTSFRGATADAAHCWPAWREQESQLAAENTRGDEGAIGRSKGRMGEAIVTLVVVVFFIILSVLAIYSIGLQRKASKGTMPRALALQEEGMTLVRRELELAERSVALQEESVTLQREVAALLRALNEKLDR
jgi:hypothetical protein